MNSSKDDKGFSMVELVIVIAIMAILISLLAPQYIKYVEKSKIAADEDLIANVHDIIAMAITDENIINKPLDGIARCNIENMDPTNKYADFMAQIKDDLAQSDLASVSGLLQSRSFRGRPIEVEITSLQQVRVIVISSDGTVSLEK